MAGCEEEDRQADQVTASSDMEDNNEATKNKGKILQVDCNGDGKGGEECDLENENSASFSETSPRRLTSRSNATHSKSAPLSLIDEKTNSQLPYDDHQSSGSPSKMFFPAGKFVAPQSAPHDEVDSDKGPSSYQEDKRQIRNAPMYTRSFPSVGLLSMASTLSEDSILNEQPGQVPTDEAEETTEDIKSSDYKIQERLPFPPISLHSNAEDKQPTLEEASAALSEEANSLVSSWKNNQNVNGIFRSIPRKGDDEETESYKPNPPPQRQEEEKTISSKESWTSKSSSRKTSRSSSSVRSRLVTSIKSGIGAVLLRSNDADSKKSATRRKPTPPLVPKKGVASSICSKQSDTSKKSTVPPACEPSMVVPDKELVTSEAKREIRKEVASISSKRGDQRQREDTGVLVGLNKEIQAEETPILFAESKGHATPAVHQVESGRAAVAEYTLPHNEILLEDNIDCHIEVGEPLLKPESFSKDIPDQDYGQSKEETKSGGSDGFEASEPDVTVAVQQTISTPIAEKRVSSSAEKINTPTTADSYNWAYKVWLNKGLLSPDVMSGKLNKKNPFIDEELEKKLRKRRETVDAHAVFRSPTLEKKKKRSNRQSFPARPVATANYSVDSSNVGDQHFANVLSQWKTKAAGKVVFETACQDVLSKRPLKPSARPPDVSKATGRYGSGSLDQTKHPASSVPIVRVSTDRTISPIRCAPKSQAWKLKNEFEKQGTRRFKRSVPAPRTMKGNKGGCDSNQTDTNFLDVRAKSAPRHQQHGNAGPSSNGRPPSIGRGSKSGRINCPDKTRPSESSIALNRASSGEDSPKQHDKYTARAQSMPRPRCPSPHPSGVPTTISITTPTKAPWSAPGSSAGTASNVPLHSFPGVSMRIADLALVSNFKNLHDNEHDRSDGDSSVANSIPKEVKVSSKKKKKLASSGKGNREFTSPSPLKLLRNVESPHQNAEEIRSPIEANFADRPWRRDNLLSRVYPDRTMVQQRAECRCVCSDSIFSGNDTMIDFFLPLMGSACTCGQKQPGLVATEEPTSLVNILRPWQVGFLGSCGIYKGDELVKANHWNGSTLASEMRQYRKKRGMAPFRTKSCRMALQIWSKTSKSFVRSIRSQLKAAEGDRGEGIQLEQARDLRLPNALYIVSAFLDSMPPDCISHGPGSTTYASDSGTSVASSITVSRASLDFSTDKTEKGSGCEAEI